MATEGRLVRMFPGPAFELADSASTSAFQRELASFLADMDVVDAGSAASTKKAGSDVFEARDTADPHYITQLLSSILHGCPGSQPADIERINKRVRNEILWHRSFAPWRRSPLWFIIRVSIQTTLQRASNHGQAEYKAFMMFLLADVVLSGDECRALSTDLLICIQNKIVRRLRKISDTVSDTLLCRATQAINKVKEIVEKRWKDIRSQQASAHPWSPESLDVTRDTVMTLSSSKAYLFARLQQRDSSVSRHKFKPSKIPRLTADDFLDPAVVAAALAREPLVALTDVEWFAVRRLEAWVDEHHSNSSACLAIGECITFYADSARQQYKDNPEDQSLMLLTIFLLWSALDRLAIVHCPLLADYSPEVPEDILNSILLRKSESIQSLFALRNYLRTRHNRAKHGSVFSNELSGSSFSVQYFLDSNSLQKLKYKVEARAQVEREERRHQFDSLKADYIKLTEAADSTSHSHQVWQRKKGSTRNCTKCSLTRMAASLKIEVHEWPLPHNTLAAQATVFELQCPPVFKAWRSTTYMILYDFCRPGLPTTGRSPNVEMKLADYVGLKDYYEGQSRIIYASTTKPFSKSHYSRQKIADVNLSSVLVNNGLCYNLFDTVLNRWVKDSFSDSSVDDLCKFILDSSSPYHSLQYAMQGTTHSVNQLIAEQASVPPELSVHEYIAFGTLRSGAMIQWFNILRELRARTLSFDRVEVHMLLVQAALETGNIAEQQLEWHRVLQQPEFSNALLSEVDQLLSSIENNWHHIVTLQTVVILTSRLLACSKEVKIVDHACSTLRVARTIAFSWVDQLVHDLSDLKSSEPQNEGISKTIRQRVCLAASTCRATYDVDSCHVNRLMNSDEDINVFIQCAIRIRDNSEFVTSTGDVPLELELFLARDRRLSQELASTVWTRCQASRTGIDDSILAIWSDYRPGSDWMQLPEQKEHWLRTTTSCASGSIECHVHYNILDGSLLINGEPLGRLPSSIIGHPTYARIFGAKILEVVPSLLPDMHFSTCNTILAPNLFLHFQLPRSDGTLIIQAEVGGEIFELVPHTAFCKEGIHDFPLSFITDYAHWLHLLPNSHSGRVEFHPLDSIWLRSEENWVLTFDAMGNTTMKSGNGSVMVDVLSATFGRMSKCLDQLDRSSKIHVTLEADGTLSAKLPRYNLAFFVNENKELECSSIRGMVVDSNQSSGTMYGLNNQLVLRNKSPYKTRIVAPGSRCVIVPFGRVSFTTHHHHTHVSISSESSHQRYFIYHIDSMIGRLVGSTLLSDIFKIYLHACTSFALPDDLTGRTGTEEALCELESARSFSFQDLSAEQVMLLHDIANLTPVVEWYPKHLKSMQTIHWNELSSLAQHWAFASRVGEILEFHDQMSSIGIGTTRNGLGCINSHLLTRLNSRTSGLYPLGKRAPDPYHDTVYDSSTNRLSHRQVRPSKTLQVTSSVTAFAHNDFAELDNVSDLWNRLQQIQVLTNEHQAIDSYRCFISPDLSNLFLPLYDLCRREYLSEASSSKMAFALSTMVYTSSQEQLTRLVPVFISFVRFSEFKSIDPPSSTKFDLGSGYSPDKTTLIRLLQNHSVQPPADKPERQALLQNHSVQPPTDKKKGKHTRQNGSMLLDMLRIGKALLFSKRRHHSEYNRLGLGDSVLKADIHKLFTGWLDNMNFGNFILRVQAILDRVRVTLSTPIPLVSNSYQSPSMGKVGLKCGRYLPEKLEDLCLRRGPCTSSSPNSPSLIETIASEPVTEAASSISDTQKLASIVKQFKNGPQELHHVYGSALENSLESYILEIDSATSKANTRHSVSLPNLENEYESRRLEFDEIYELVLIALSPKTPLEKAIAEAGQWPSMRLRPLLSLLAKDKLDVAMSSRWESSIVALVQAFLRLQRSRRMLFYKLSGLEEDLLKELKNVEYERDISFRRPDWLLIQINGDFTARPVQSRVAQEMISPSSGQNCLTQLNMGEGKSAVIVPLVSSALADGQRLVRVVVLKPLVNQMFDLLVNRLSGLTNRRIFYLPFSRDFKSETTYLRKIQSLYETCVREKGVLLIQPEHILSFRLMGIDLISGMHSEAGKQLLQSHRWLLSTSRDILDESDEILRATYQLVYTSGLQEPMDNHPDRWTIIQEVIGYVQKHASILHSTYSTGLEVDHLGDIGSPVIRILDAEAGDELVDSVIRELTSSNRFKLLPLHIRPAAEDFIRCRCCSANALDELRSFLQNSSIWKDLLLYRGLLGHGLLRFVLQDKRWRVDYGLDLTRTLLAVPYRAKDLPSLRADFGHPDVALALTCLSYYYGGLTEEQLDQCFELLFKHDDPPLEYNQWVSGHNKVPLSFRDIRSVNLDDEHQRKMILGPLFRRNKAVIDFYLSNLVFPRYAKQFPKRLSTSAWDLAETKVHVTTGFSGTNDNRYLLPTSIKQNDTTAVGDYDPFGQLATNAKVLSTLLRPENGTYCCVDGLNGCSPTGSDFLELLVRQNPPVRVLLDVGAQMLDMQNTELVTRWLSLVQDLHAIVFFDDHDELVVISRDNQVEKFVTSQYHEKMDLCAVYLDDSHTRGTDLKLPNEFRAVVTLGPKLTKDRLVQGCMRMRQLGRGQSVVFFAPREVDRSIRACELYPLEPSVQVSTADILRWTMWQTCGHIRRYLPHWAQQGIEYNRRNDAWVFYEGDPSASGSLEKLRSSWEEPDARSLGEMYEAQQDPDVTSFHPAFELPNLKERLDLLGVSVLSDVSADEEQERQVSKEAEKERQHERPPKVKPASSELHGALKSLIKKCEFNLGTNSPFIPLFSPLSSDHQWSEALFSTKDFATTVQGGASVGDFLRPVNWILSVPAHRALIALSPFEVNELLPLIWKSKHVHLHIYAPRVNQNMKTMEDLRFFTVPPLPTSSDPLAFIPDLVLQLNLFAGQLFLKDSETYQQLCRVLGLIGAESGPRIWNSDGFVKPEDRTGAMKEQCRMVTSPVTFLKELFSSRRKGLGYAPTHMGKILNVKPLELKDFEQ
ncbi:hypothetical protein C0992_010818 [Termitomyces sp. T32_za158]|nr:hypothetical protein C0992_010818 [Termitomyces sp. T32_za158]